MTAANLTATMVMDTVAVAEISVTISTAPMRQLPPSPAPALTRCIFVRCAVEGGGSSERELFGALAVIAKWTVARNNSNHNNNKCRQTRTRTHTQTLAHTHIVAHTFRLLSWFIVVTVWQPYYFPVACRLSLSSSLPYCLLPLSSPSPVFLPSLLLYLLRFCHFKVLR